MSSHDMRKIGSFYFVIKINNLKLACPLTAKTQFTSYVTEKYIYFKKILVYLLHSSDTVFPYHEKWFVKAM